MCFEETTETRRYTDSLGMPIPGATALELPTLNLLPTTDVCCSIGCDNRDDGDEKAYFLDACTSSGSVPNEPVFTIENLSTNAECVKTTVSSVHYTFSDGEPACSA